jgi:hypothetical protein
MITGVASDSKMGDSKPSPFENREGVGTRKLRFKGWPTGQRRLMRTAIHRMTNKRMCLQFVASVAPLRFKGAYIR